MSSLAKYFTAFFLLINCKNFCQDPLESNTSVDKFIRVKDEVSFNLDGASAGLKYTNIAGSPFWQDQFKLASIYENGSKIGTVPIKINLFSNEVYFLKGEEVLALPSNKSYRIIFLRPDSTTFLSRVPDLFLNRIKLDGFVEVLNKGNFQLLKYAKKELSSADSAMGLKRYFFVETNYYFLMNDQKVERIKKMDRETLLANLPASRSLEKWIETNHLNLKKEKDVVVFLKHYNSAIQKNN